MADEVAFIKEVLQGNPTAVARAISRVERGGADARDLIRAIFSHSGHAYVVGVTGGPGTGKSTLVNALAKEFKRRDRRVAIIAVDPSSPFTGGAILGDRLRMQDLSGTGVFIRSMATRGHLGGLTAGVADALTVLDTAGFDLIFVETVGAGQGEVEIAKNAHTTLVIEAPGLGDDIQAIKAGVMEIADVLVVNKADREGAEAAAAVLELTLSLSKDANGLAKGARPIQRLNIERQPATDLSAAAKSGALTKVQGGTLLVGAPQRFQKSATQIAPPNVKAKVAQPKIQHGWGGVANEAQLKEKIKTENPKNIPPPTRAAAGASPAAGGISPAASPGAIASPAVSASVAPGERGKRPGRPGALGTPAGSPAGAVSPAPGALVTPTERGKRPRRPGAPTQPGFTPARSPGEAASPAIQGSPAGTPVAPERGKRKGKPGEAVATPGQSTEAPTGGAQTTPFAGKHKGRAVPPEFTPSTGAPAGAPAATQPPSKHKGQFERGVASPTPGQPGGAGNMPEPGRARSAGAPTGAGAAAPGEPGGKQKGKGVYAQPGGAPEAASPAGVAPGHGKPERGKKKGQEGSPSPGPQ